MIFGLGLGTQILELVKFLPSPTPPRGVFSPRPLHPSAPLPPFHSSGSVDPTLSLGLAAADEGHAALSRPDCCVSAIIVEDINLYIFLNLKNPLFGWIPI